MILQDAADRRMALAVHWLSATQINAKLGELSLSGRCTASRLRRDGELLGAYVMQPAPGYRYPPWQLSSDGWPVDFLWEILKVLRSDGPFSCKQGDLHRSTGWGEIEWFLSGHALLDGISPAMALGIDPALVLRAARIEFESDV
ncbi:hypothetical protein [Stenotrophomonas maltophilia]|uniref:hypothetical protein n=1 Tax=Stenotrophomonas maltophilia TaxID=40324 RepID=UPI001F291B34|nr:hypothetical protein [Stenotrophomonas maltophilia]